MKLNLGCANDIKEGYINVDLYSTDSRVKVADVRNLDFVEDLSVDEIIARDVLEHIPFQEAAPSIKEWCRVLGHNGTILIQTTNVDEHVKAFSNNIWDLATLNHMMFAGQGWVDSMSRGHDWHKSIYSVDYIQGELKKNGLSIVEVKTDKSEGYRDGNLNLYVWARKP